MIQFEQEPGSAECCMYMSHITEELLHTKTNHQGRRFSYYVAEELSSSSAS